MPMKRSFLPRRIIHRSLVLPKSRKEGESRDFHSVDRLGKREEKDDGNGRGQQQHQGVSSGHYESGSWAGMLPELLGEIMQRVEASEQKWPQRQNVVACACVCKRWREATKEAVEKKHPAGKITFPSSLKKAGPNDSPVQCLIKRDKKNAAFYLYLALSPSLMDQGKLLLAARRYRSGAHTEYIISLDSGDLSQGSKSFVGKLRSDFLGTNFTIYDSQPPHSGAQASNSRGGRRVANKQISPQVPAGNFKVGHVSYKFNLLKSRGPRRMVCSLTCPTENYEDDSKMKTGVTILKNKAARWHEHLECWCLNFHGRVTVASVKNFQIVAARPDGKGDEETVLLQFGKVGDDTFTMDYRHPLSPFLAFAICLTSFGTKLACE
ncbi:hypothetical protein ACS0TY_018203 [Phlomoides rotata]